MSVQLLPFHLVINNSLICLYQIQALVKEFLFARQVILQRRKLLVNSLDMFMMKLDMCCVSIGQVSTCYLILLRPSILYCLVCGFHVKL